MTAMETAPEVLARQLVRWGVEFGSGVPDSSLAGVFRAVEREAAIRFVPAPRDDIAVGLAVGAFLGGVRASVLVMQSSGVGYAANALTSLGSLYRIPVVLVVGWRGISGDDAPEHRIIGPAIQPLLDALGVPRWLAHDGSEVEAATARAAQTAREDRCPAALLAALEALT